MKITGAEHRWQEFWGRNKLSPGMGEAIARNYWSRLRAEIPLRRDWIGLDFGCGQGYILRLMARDLKYVYALDASPAMVALSRATTRGCGNVEISQTNSPPPNFHQPLFDLIVVNSCAQYLNDRELKDWLGWWINSLSSRGLLVLSDLYPRWTSRRRNCLETLNWGWRQGCLRGVLLEFWLLFRHRYFREVHYGRDPEKLLALISACGGEGRRLYRNLDFLSTRDTIIVRRGK